MFLRRPLAAQKAQVLLPGAALLVGLAFTGVAGRLYYDPAQDALLLQFHFLSGTMLSIAFAITAWSLASTRQRALRLADKMTASLRETEAFLHTVIKSLPSPMFVKDQEQRWILVNQAFCEMLSLPAQALLGRRTHELLKPELAARILTEDQSLFASGSTVEAETLRITDDGKQRWYLRRKTCVQLPTGRRVIVGLFFDIHRQKVAEQELRGHRDDLQQMIEERTRELVTALSRAEDANRAKSEFLANMSHELRTPLHAILSFAKLGVENSAGDEREGTRLSQYFARIHASGQRLLTLLDDLLDLSKLEAGKMHYVMGEHDVTEAVTEVLAELEELARAKNLRLALEASAESTRAWFDPIRMGQVLRNLISNAIKFSPTGAEIRITIANAMIPAGRRADDPPAVEGLKLTISDRGPGIPPEELDSVFEKFVQSTRTRTGAGGTGLGLSICREIVSAHGGRIEASNNPDGGSSLSFTVPLRASAAAGGEELEAA